MIRKIDTNWKICDAFIWRGEYLHPIQDFNTFDLRDLIGIDEQKEMLLKNTESFLSNNGGLNVLLYGPRGCGKSTLARAVFTHFLNNGLKIIQVSTQDIAIIPVLLDSMRIQPYKFIIFCDDLSFEEGDTSYKVLKVVLDGSIEKIPSNILIYATSNRKHIIPEYENDNLNVAIVNKEMHFADAVEERISLSDRFGLIIPFYKIASEEYLRIVGMYFNEDLSEDLKNKALAYATKKGQRSGRVAYDFFRANKIGLI